MHTIKLYNILIQLSIISVKLSVQQCFTVFSSRKKLKICIDKTVRHMYNNKYYNKR